MNTDSVLLFDGICNLCNRSVKFVSKRDKKKIIFYASLQSDCGKQLLEQYGLTATMPDSLVWIEQGKAYIKSTAVLKLSRHLTAAWPIVYWFIIIPRPIRDAVYNWVSANRYHWFGKLDTCMMPDAALQKRFLS
jgi:predicted DCC family thiol-disulfide oxidoreductase YuxK